MLQKHLKVVAKNVQYTSVDTQNEIISICKSLVLEKIVKDVQESGMFSIIRSYVMSVLTLLTMNSYRCHSGM